MYMPIVSIIVPVYNAEKYLEECIISLMNQSLDKIEVICVDNNSTDSSAEILNSLHLKYGEKLVVSEETQKGGWYARKKGIRVSKGKYIAFCDSDDVVDSNMFEKMIEQISMNGSEMCVCAFDRISENDHSVISREMRQFGNQTIETRNNTLVLPIINTALWNKVFKRELFEEFISFDNPPRIMEDAMLLLSVFPKVKSVTFTDEVLYHYYVRSKSAMSYVDPTELPTILEDMAITRQWVTQRCPANELDMVTSLMAFIHIGISLPVKMINAEVNLSSKVREIRDILEQEYPQYKQLKWCKLSSVYKKNYLKTCLAIKVFGTPLYPMFLKLYKFVTVRLHIEIKW